MERYAQIHRAGRWVRQGGGRPAAAVARALNSYALALENGGNYAAELKLARRARALAAGESGREQVALRAGEPWADAILADMESMDGAGRTDWAGVLECCGRLSGAQPGEKWLKEVEGHIAAIGEDDFAERMCCWLELVGKQGAAKPEIRSDFGVETAELIHPQNAEILKGLAWACSLVPDERMASLIGDVGAACFKKVTGWGPRAPKVANACVGSLARMGSSEAIAQLGRLESKVKHASARARVGKGLHAAAKKAGTSVDELMESSVPDFGLKEIGCLTRSFAECQARLDLAQAGGPRLSWLNQDGRELKDVPASVKRDFAEELKVLKRLEKDLTGLIDSLRFRIERSWIDQRSWTAATWRQRLIDHPVTGSLGRRLIWTIDGRPAMWFEGGFVDAGGQPLSLDGAMLVELWHPIGSTPDEVRAWRKRLAEHQVTQPFKQAHREIYVLTDAERGTATYSNRFAAHILRQHGFAQLCQQRGWKYTLQGQWDSANTPTLSLPRWNLEVQFFVDALGHEVAAASGVFLTASTDQVRFVRASGEAVPLTEILPIVFSEVMRDVDLFVGVSSVGADPAWADQGEHHDYWRQSSFGELSVSAATRKQVLAEILPNLKIAHRCRIADRFLIVKGELRTYKIHLGSGNILMEPNDQYLCIVPGRVSGSHTADKVFLPFEGDGLLSVILSKAFMLADDARIKDESITRQIKRGL